MNVSGMGDPCARVSQAATRAKEFIEDLAKAQKITLALAASAVDSDGNKDLTIANFLNYIGKIERNEVALPGLVTPEQHAQFDKEIRKLKKKLSAYRDENTSLIEMLYTSKGKFMALYNCGKGFDEEHPSP